jgi:serine-type D-Ala-D-Ala carboxypeptidase/endopeptidase (penicillin-binding protein 4)
MYSHFAFGAFMASYCSAREDDLSKINGKKIEAFRPIGSVSKLVTTYWALYKKHPQTRFTTSFYIKKVPGSKKVDIHFQGTHDPYFGKESFHRFISLLNREKIYAIRKLTFDEKFKIFWNVSGGPMLYVPPDKIRAQIYKPGQKVETGFYDADSPTPKEIINELSAKRTLNWLSGYQKTRGWHLNNLIEQILKSKKFNVKNRAEAKVEAEKLSMVLHPKISIDKIEFLSSNAFEPGSADKRTISSSFLWRLLKEMNRNSNNHAANQVFEWLGGAEEFKKFAEKQGFTEDDITMYNGHGGRHYLDLKKGTSVFNSAKCDTILMILSKLSKVMQYYKPIVENGITTQDYGGMTGRLSDVLPVPALDKTSTVRGIVGKSIRQSIAAKTGTVGPASTLAGVFNAQTSQVFFYYNAATKPVEEDWNKGHRLIVNRVKKLPSEYEPGMDFNPQHLTAFSPFDDSLFGLEDHQDEELEREAEKEELEEDSKS